MAKAPLFVHVRLRDGRELVVHAKFPEFLATVTHNSDGTIDINPKNWLCDQSKIDVQSLAGLMRRMGDWYYFTVVKKEDYDDSK
jgi:hypothetical protein